MQLICAIKLKFCTARARCPATATLAGAATRFTTVDTLFLGISLLDAPATRPNGRGRSGRNENKA